MVLSEAYAAILQGLHVIVYQGTETDRVSGMAYGSSCLYGNQMQVIQEGTLASQT
jgi:hypothetical protein